MCVCFSRVWSCHPQPSVLKGGLSESLVRVEVSGDCPNTSDVVEVSIDDSVLDLKRILQEAYGQQWGLSDRRLDRHGLALGWEVVFCDSALSYHLFLHDYGVKHGDIVHAVVRRE